MLRIDGAFSRHSVAGCAKVRRTASGLDATSAYAHRGSCPILLSEADYAVFLDLLYGAAVEPSDWERAIARFADLVGGAKAWLPELNLANGSGQGVIARIEPTAQETYFQYFASRNPFLQRRIAEPWPLNVRTDEDEFSKDEFTRTEYYNDFLKPQDIHSVLIVRLGRRGGMQSTLNVTRPGHQDQFARSDLEVARRLQPHVIRAFDLSRRFADLGAFAAGLTEALDRSLHGVLLLDDTGRIVHANTLAERLLREREGLCVVHGRLSASPNDVGRRLERLIGEAVGRGAGRRTGGSMALPTPSRVLPLSLIVAPLRSDRLAMPAGPCVIVCVTDLEAGVSPPAQQLAAVFRLTPAEGRVALALFEGATPREAAAALGLSPHTVHVHLAHIFEKTATKRQAELIQVMMRTVTGRPD
jgi:DNA-binding CsgD family transcriptional regulator